MFLVSGSWYDALDPELQEIISRNAKDIAGWERDLVAQEEATYLETIKASGTTVIELSEEERAKMKEATASVYDVAKDIVGAELLDLVVKAAG